MKLDVTRDVISDLWPLYRSGDASSATRTLVEAFLAADDAFGSTLRLSNGLTKGLPLVRLSPDAERQLLDDARRRARTKLLVIAGSVGAAAIVALVALGGLLLLLFGRLL